MFEFPLFNEIATGAAALGGALGLRAAFASYALYQTRRQAVTAVAGFKRKIQRSFAPILQEKDTAPADFMDFMQASDDLTRVAAAEAARMKIPEVDRLTGASDLREAMEAIEKTFLAVYAGTAQRKLTSLVKHQVVHRLIEHGHKLPARVMDSGAKPLGPVEEHVVNFLDGVGVMDIATQAGEIIADVLPDSVIIIADAAADFLIIPGIGSGVKALFREAKMWTNNETDAGSALIGGLMPVGVRSALVAIGVSMDSACMWASCGAFTALSYWLGSKFKNSFQKNLINIQLGILKPYLEEIQTRKKRALGVIAKSIESNFGDFPDLIRAVPDYIDEPEIRLFVTRVAVAYAADAQVAEADIRDDCERTIQKLPYRNGLDIFLGIDRSLKPAELFRDAADQVVAPLKSASRTIGRLAENDARETVIFAFEQPVLRNGDVVRLIDELLSRLPEITVRHHGTIEAWRTRCGDAWTNGTQNFGNAMKSEQQEIDRLTEKLAPKMREPREQIRANLKRLGLDPAQCP